MTPADADDLRLFAYGLLLTGEREHDLLERAELLGEVVTAPKYTLVDLGVFPALLDHGTVAVHGELYRIDRKVRFSIDVKKEVPVLFQRIVVELFDGTRAEAYAMKDDQVRGKRRLAGGSWKGRFAPRPRAELGGPLVQAAKRRFQGR